MYKVYESRAGSEQWHCYFRDKSNREIVQEMVEQEMVKV